MLTTTIRDGPLTPPTGRKARQTYQRLIDAVVACIAANGSFSGEEVAERAKVATATFYAYFSSRDEALAAAFDQVLRDLNDRSRPFLKVERLLEDGLVSTIHGLARSVIDQFRNQHLIYRLAISRMSAEPQIREVYRHREQEAYGDMQQFVRLGMLAGQIREGDVDTLATTVLITLQGYNNPILVRDGLPEAVLDELAGMLVRLLQPASGPD